MGCTVSRFGSIVTSSSKRFDFTGFQPMLSSFQELFYCILVNSKAHEFKPDVVFVDKIVSKFSDPSPQFLEPELESFTKYQVLPFTVL